MLHVSSSLFVVYYRGYLSGGRPFLPRRPAKYNGVAETVSAKTAQNITGVFLKKLDFQLPWSENVLLSAGKKEFVFVQYDGIIHIDCGISPFVKKKGNSCQRNMDFGRRYYA